MKPEELKRRLEALNKGLSMTIYRTRHLARVHGDSCSVSYRKQHVMSVHNRFIPKMQNGHFYSEYEDGDGRLYFPSAHQLASKLMRKRILTRKEAKTLWQ